MERRAIAYRTVKGEALEPQLRQSWALPAMRLGSTGAGAESAGGSSAASWSAQDFSSLLQG